MVMAMEGDIGEHGITPCRTNADAMYLSVGRMVRAKDRTAMEEGYQKRDTWELLIHTVDINDLDGHHSCIRR